MFSNALALLATAVVVNAMTGCASGPALPYEPDSPLTAHLPIRQAGIRDLRREFTPFFDAELEHLDFGLGTRGAGNYLHLPPPHAGAPTPRPGPSRPDAGFASTAVLIVPGFLGECLADQALPFSDGRVRERSSAYTAAYETYKTGLGLHSIEAIHVGGRAGSAANAALIDSAILTLSEDSGVASIVLVAYSKGVADTLEALAELQRRQAVPAKLQAFVSVAGAVMGTPIADRYESVYEALAARFPLGACPVHDDSALRSLSTAYRARWLAETQLPASVAMYSVLAYTARANVGPGLRLFHDLLALSDPQNDGQVIAADAMLPDSDVLAVANSDHWDFVLPLSMNPSLLVSELASGTDYPRQALFRALMRYVVGELSWRSASPAHPHPDPLPLMRERE